MFGDCDSHLPLLSQEGDTQIVDDVGGNLFIGGNLPDGYDTYRPLSNSTDCRTFDEHIFPPDPYKMQSDNYSNSEGSDGIMDLVAPNDVLPLSFGSYSSLDLFISSCNVNYLPSSMDSACTWEDDILNNLNVSVAESKDVAVDMTSVDMTSVDINSVDMDAVAMFAYNFLSDDNSNSNDSTASQKQYHPDYDHCYSKQSETRDLSDSDVDVVSFDADADEEFQIPVVPKLQILPFRNKKQRSKMRVQKSQRMKRNRSPLSAKTLNDAMKLNIKRSGNIRTINRRQINNSVETSPSNSVPSSAPSSRSSSDVEDAGKRANHNSSERKRREVLRTNLQTLRECVPALQHNLKAPKVHILNSAKEHVAFLEREEREKRVIKENERKRKRFLELKLKKLKKECQPYLNYC